jgi:hypothetical protein
MPFQFSRQSAPENTGIASIPGNRMIGGVSNTLIPLFPASQTFVYNPWRLRKPQNGDATMFERPFSRRRLVMLFCAVTLFTSFQRTLVASAADKDAANKEIKVAGILMQKQDASISVKADGEDEPVKYLINASDTKVTGAMQKIFDAARVQLTYKQDGDSRQLVSIKRQIFKDTGTITGNVVKVYNDFWVEVKPKTGASDAYAPGANFNDKNFMDKLKGLKPGDLVTIKFYTDFERHRIETLTIQKKADAASTGNTLQTGPTPKK